MSKVDVLAVMDTLNLADPNQRPELTRARDAVGELIEACGPVLRHDRAFDTGPEARLRAALARCRGDEE